MTGASEFDAIVIAGGRATRLGGVDKTALLFEGRTLLQRALDAVADARQIVVVGSEVNIDGVTHATEEPRWGGPAAALQAGMDCLRTSRVEFTVVIAADLPRVADALPVLLASLDDGDGVIAVDSTGRRQHLLGVYRMAALRHAIADSQTLAHAPVRAITGALLLREVAVSDELCADVDTADDAVRHGIALHPLAHAG
jgi:molybdopterin-guanine dinucleotide biosynthesis protein A